MKHEIDIRNGSGWNHYQALGKLTTLPRGTRGLMADNKVTRLTISPYDSERPFGIAARFYDADGEELFCLSFDQNDTASWIATRVVALLEEGIEDRKARRAIEIAAKELATAKAAGFSTAAEHRQHLAHIAETERKARAEKLHAQEAADALAATAMFDRLVATVREFPQAERLTRTTARSASIWLLWSSISTMRSGVAARSQEWLANSNLRPPLEPISYSAGGGARPGSIGAGAPPT